MGEYSPTIGLEIHAELKTATKMFCGSKNDPDEKRPNVNVCPVCMGHPGTLPVANQQAVQHVLTVGTALGSTLADYTEFDRKNYFYPDLPKGYQISQYQFPLISGGSLAGVTLTRIHLEEDAARSYHDASGGSLIDYNRAGVPLMELVTEPVIKNAEQAVAFAKSLQALLRRVGASDANLEKGEMRFDVNISVSSNKKLGTKVEIKNVNSFRSLERSIAFEIKRQSDLLDRGENVIQETRGWDDVQEITSSQRLKESSHDYRYFPDPDIPKFALSRIAEYSTAAINAKLPELPWVQHDRYVQLGLKPDDAAILVADDGYAAFFDEHVVKKTKDAEVMRAAANLLLGELRGKGASTSDLQMLNNSLVELADMFVKEEISSRATKEILAHLLTEDKKPRDIAKEQGLLQVVDETAIAAIVDSVIQENQAVFADFAKGKQEAVQFLIGQAMKKSKGTAKPDLLRKIFHSKTS